MAECHANGCGLLAASCQQLGKLVRLRRFHLFPTANPGPVGELDLVSRSRSRWTGPVGRSHQFSSAILSPVGSSFPRKEPRAEAIARYLCRVFRNPTAAKPLIVSLLPRKARVLQWTFEPGPSWRLYCTPRRLPFGARRWRRQATEVS
jgi:hypothetical protein